MIKYVKRLFYKVAVECCTDSALQCFPFLYSANSWTIDQPCSSFSGGDNNNVPDNCDGNCPRIEQAEVSIA
jgi:hypothetical protein